jgi:hypothetical protein
MNFGHHPDPVVDFVTEVEAIEREITDRNAGMPATIDLRARMERAMQFKVGGSAEAVGAKDDLRKFAAGFHAGEAASWPEGLLTRVKAALSRVESGRAALRSIPADPNGDVDLVLAEVQYLMEGKWPPFWIKKPDDASGVQTDRGTAP